MFVSWLELRDFNFKKLHLMAALPVWEAKISDGLEKLSRNLCYNFSAFKYKTQVILFQI
jgi:hypothetical protein